MQQPGSRLNQIRRDHVDTSKSNEPSLPKMICGRCLCLEPYMSINHTHSRPKGKEFRRDQALADQPEGST